MKKSELTIFAIDSAGEEVETTCDGKKLAIHLIDYTYRLSEEIGNQIDISGINVNAAINHVLELMANKKKLKMATQIEYKLDKEYIPLIYAYLFTAEFNNCLEDENYTEAMESLFLANTMFEAYKKEIVTLGSLENIKKIILSENASKAARERVNKDPKTQAVKLIEETEYPIKKHLFHLRGRRTEFVNAMHTKYPIITNPDSIKRLVDRLNKQNGITQKKTK